MAISMLFDKFKLNSSTQLRLSGPGREGGGVLMKSLDDLGRITHHVAGG